MVNPAPLSYPSKFIIVQKLQLRSSLIVDSNNTGRAKLVLQENETGNQSHRSLSRALAEKYVRIQWPAEFWACADGVLNMAMTDPFSTSADNQGHNPKMETHWGQHSYKWAWVFILSAQQYWFLLISNKLYWFQKNYPFFSDFKNYSSCLSGTTYLNFRFASL